MKNFIENYFKDRRSSKISKNNGIKNFGPYVGPRPFYRNNEDQKRFFGRDSDAEEIVSLILSHRLVLVYAQSGAGKTSILNAKVAPMLEKYGFQVLPSARIGNVSNNKKYSSSEMTITSPDIKNMYIFNALQSLLPEGIDPQSLLDTQQLTDFLKAYYPPFSISIDKRTDPAITIDKNKGEAKESQLLIFDQLEELVTFYPNDRWREQQKDFFRQVAKALNDNPLLYIVFVIREDYLADLDPFVALLPERLRPRFRLEPLRKSNALLAIKKPLEKTNSALYQSYQKEIDNDINHIIDDLLNIKSIDPFSGQISVRKGQFVEPIHLQIVCQRWWEKIADPNNKPFEQNIISVPDVDTALEEFYEDAINEVINEGKIKESYIRKWCEENLITQSGTRSIVYKDLGTTTRGLENNLIDLLEKRYFIKENLRSGTRWCELTHDRLIKPILSSNKKWKKEQQKRNGLKMIKISIPAIISIIVILIFFETLYVIPPVESFSVGVLPFLLSVDQNSGLVYVTHPASDTISVINGKRNDLINEIKVRDGPADIAIDSKNNLIYTLHPKNKNISVIQRDNLIDVLPPFIKQIPIIYGIFDYKVIRNIPLNHIPYSLGIDSNHSKLYVSHYSASNNLSVIDTNTGKVSSEINNVGDKPSDIYVDSKFNKVYVANSGDNTVSVINGTDNNIIKRIPVGKNPISIAFNPNDNKIYVANSGDNTVSVIHGTDNNMIEKIPVGKNPISIAFNPNDNKIYVVNKGDSTVSVINGNYDIVVSLFEVGNNPTSVIINEKQNILYVVNNRDHAVTSIDMGNNNPLYHPSMKNIRYIFFNDSRSQLEINKVPISNHPAGITLDYDNNNNPMLYVVNTDSDTVSVIDGIKKEVKEQIKVGHKPKDIDIHTQNNTVYVSNAMSNTVTVIDGENRVITNIPTGGKHPTGIAVDEKSNLIYVANTDSDTVSVIDGTTNKVKLTPIKVGNGPTGIAVDEEERNGFHSTLVYVTNYIDGSISVIDGTTTTVKSTIKVGNGPTGIAIDSKNKLVYVANCKDDTLSVIDTTNHTNYGEINMTRDYPGDCPTSIAVDSKNNKIYVLNALSDNISIIDTDLIIGSLQSSKIIEPFMKYITFVISAGETPTDISLNKGEIYVTDKDNNIAKVLDVPNS
jgi:YVTN family beta-propeller protein